MHDGGWQSFHRRWSRLKPPLRANSDVVAALAAALEYHRACALLLGVTPELADIAEQTIAVDKSETMIAHIWPGDSESRRAVLGDWLAMPFPRPQFSAVLGDGSLNALRYSDYPALFAQLETVLQPGARLAIRVYATPDDGETVDAVRRAARAGGVGGFHAFKWRLAMAIATEKRSPDVPVALIHHVFEREFPDRAALGRTNNWSAEDIDEIDAYAASGLAYSFPTHGEFVAALPSSFAGARFCRSGDYELAERCPIFIADFAP
jgi:hypothetical protein